VKDYLEYENARNKAHAELYAKLLKKAFGDCEVMIGHHLTFEFRGELSTENEIPSADTMMFCHELMGKVFGDKAGLVMRSLALVPASGRDELLADYYNRFVALKE